VVSWGGRGMRRGSDKVRRDGRHWYVTGCPKGSRELDGGIGKTEGKQVLPSQEDDLDDLIV